MADLEGKTIAATYESLLNVGTANNQNLDATPRIIEDGVGTNSALWLATGAVHLGVDDTGADFRVFSATTNEGLFYDASEDEFGLLLTTKLKFHDIGGGEEMYASGDGVLLLNSGTSLTITTPTLDLTCSTKVDFDSPILDTVTQGVTVELKQQVDALAFDGDADNILNIDAANNRVGIGTAAPECDLHIQDATIPRVLIDSSATSGSNMRGILDMKDGNNDGWRMVYIADDDKQYLAFEAIENDSNTTAMIIEDTGNVGIGTISPNELLEVRGITFTDATCDTGSNTTVAHDDDNGKITVGMAVTGSGIPAGAYVSAVASDTSFTLSAAATTSLTDTTLTFSEAGILTLSTASTDVDDGDLIGKINFQAPVEGTGTDAILVGASIHAEGAEAFSSSNNSTALVFSTGTTSLPIERMRINQDGYVGIGTASPDTLLAISGAGAIVTSAITCYSDDGAHFPALYLRKADGTEADPDLVHDNDVLGVIYFQGLDADSGGSYMPGAAIIARVDGTPTDDQMPCELEFWSNTGDSSGTKNAYIHEGGDFYTNDGSVSSIASDERLKKDIRDFTHGLSVVNQLNPVYYKFNGKNGRNEDVEDRIGMLANIVKDIAPDITKTTMGELDGVDTELYTMSYDKLIFYVVNAIQELSAKVTALENA